jgi:ABC-2 type transport system ATP-binding protein
MPEQKSPTAPAGGPSILGIASGQKRMEGRRDRAAQEGGLAIETSNLTKHFGSIKAVNGIDLRIQRGQIFGFLGANGSGKSTTVRMLTTLLALTAGGAWVDGLDISREGREVRRRIGVALQEAGLDDLQTGRELLRLQSRLYSVPRAAIERRVDELLRVVDLEADADRRVGTYSGGMKRRLDLASALVHEPSIIFLDEPTTGLDPISRESLWRYLEVLNRELGVTIFLTTQYMEEADRLAGEVAILDKGAIVSQGSPAELKAAIAADVVSIELEGDGADVAPGAGQAVDSLRELAGVEDVQLDWALLSVYVRNGSGAVSAMVRLLDEAGIPFGDVRISHPTLDDVFLRATGHHMEPAGESPPDLKR